MRLRRKSKEVEQPAEERDQVVRCRFQTAFADQLRKILKEKNGTPKKPMIRRSS